MMTIIETSEDCATAVGRLFPDAEIQAPYIEYGRSLPTKTDCQNARAKLSAKLQAAIAAKRTAFHFGLHGLEPYLGR